MKITDFPMFVKWVLILNDDSLEKVCLISGIS